MRLAFLVLAALLAACAPRQARCDLDVSSDVNFSGPNARDTITARVIGPSCDKTIGLYTIHAEDGYPIWSWTAPMSHRFGDIFDHANEREMRDFLSRWSHPSLSTTNTAPAFARLAPGQTTLDSLTYEDIRSRDLPMLCHLSGTARETCVFWEPAAGGAGHFLDREVEGSAT